MAMNYQNFASLGVNLNRQKNGPLDISNVFTSAADLKYYLTEGAYTEGVSEYWYKNANEKVVPYPYEGQVLATVIDGDVNVYVLRLKADGSFEAKAIEPDVDGKTIKLTDGKLELIGLPADTNGKTYVPSFVNGVLTWAEPDYTVTNNLASAVSSLDGRATALETTVNGKAAVGNEGDEGYVAPVVGLVDKVAANAQAIADEVAARRDAIGAASVPAQGVEGEDGYEAAKPATGMHAVIEAAEASAKNYTDSKASELNSAITGVASRTTALETKAANLETAKNDHETRLEKVEAFFGDAERSDDGYAHLDKALDTLVEIQDFLSSDEGSKVQDIIDSIATNADNIDGLEAEFAENGRVTKAEADITAVAGRATALEGRAAKLENIAKSYLADGEYAEDAIKIDVDAAQSTADAAVAAIGTASADGKAATGAYIAIEAAAELGQTGIDNAATAKSAADAAQSTADAASGEASRAHSRLDLVEPRAAKLEAIVDGYGAEDDTYETIKAHVDAVSEKAELGIANAAKAQVAAEAADGKGQKGIEDAAKAQAAAEAADARAAKAQTDLDKAEEAIETLQDVVEKGDNTNEKLRSAITALENIVVKGDDGNVKLGKEIDAIRTTVGDASSGIVKDLAATTSTANEAKATATSNNVRLGAVESDYLKYVAAVNDEGEVDKSKPGKLVIGKEGVDVLIFNCGTALTNIVTE